MMGKEYETVKETLFTLARLFFILKTMEESYEFSNVQNSNVLEMLRISMNDVWSFLERLLKKVFDKAFTYNKNEPHSLRKCFEEMKERDLNLCKRKRVRFEWLPSDSIENEIFYNIMLTKVFELPFYNPCFRGSIFTKSLNKNLTSKAIVY